MELQLANKRACLGLSPKSTLLHALDTRPIQASHHTIVGDRGKGDTPNSSDGVVLYQSSHLDSAQSELIVPGPHGSFDLPQTVAEIQRILHLHLQATGRRSTEVFARATDEPTPAGPLPKTSLFRMQ